MSFGNLQAGSSLFARWDFRQSQQIPFLEQGKSNCNVLGFLIFCILSCWGEIGKVYIFLDGKI